MQSEEEQVRYLQEESHVEADIRLSDFSDQWSEYGGWKGKRFDATGYFRTQHDGERWWLVDSNAYMFYSNGLDCIIPDEECPVEGIVSLFSWLPEEEGAYKEAWGVNTWYGPVKSINFSAVNLIRAFGDINKVGLKTGLPVMIGEYHFGALDRGMTATGLRGVTSQEERGKAYRYYS